MTYVRKGPANRDAARPSRRAFVKVGAVMGVSMAALPRAATAASRERVAGASNRIHVAHIGVGAVGWMNAVCFQENATDWNTLSVAVADPSTRRLRQARALLATGRAQDAEPRAYRDYRRILDDNDIDAVVIAAPDASHAGVVFDALQARKHVYIASLAAPDLDVDYRVYDAWRAAGRIVQVGGLNTSHRRYRAARDLVHSGRLGELTSVEAWSSIAGPTDRSKLDDILAQHLPTQFASASMIMGGLDWPTVVSCMRGGGTIHLMALMSGGWTFRFTGRTADEPACTETVHGRDAALTVTEDQLRLAPRGPASKGVRDTVTSVRQTGNPVHRHQKDFVDAVRQGIQPSGNLELATRARVLASLARMALAAGRAIAFDPAERAARVA